MDMALFWLIIAIVGFSLSGIALIASIFIFLKYKIPTVIGDLSGRTVAREIKAMRAANESSGDKIHKSSGVNANRGKLTKNVNDDKINEYKKSSGDISNSFNNTDSGQYSYSPDSQFEPQNHVTTPGVKSTEVLSSNVGEVDIENVSGTAVLNEPRQTDILTEPRQTEILSTARQTEVLVESRQTEILSQTSHTELLVEDDSGFAVQAGTSILDEEDVSVPYTSKPVTFKITKSVVEIHTDEVI